MTLSSVCRRLVVEPVWKTIFGSAINVHGLFQAFILLVVECSMNEKRERFGPTFLFCETGDLEQTTEVKKLIHTWWVTPAFADSSYVRMHVQTYERVYVRGYVSTHARAHVRRYVYKCVRCTRSIHHDLEPWPPAEVVSSTCANVGWAWWKDTPWNTSLRALQYYIPCKKESHFSAATKENFKHKT